MLNEKSIVITGGTGSFGRKFVETVLRKYKLSKLVILSRDEYKQYELSKKFNENDYPCLRYYLGDVRDKDRLYRAFSGIDYIIHAAALKQVPSIEFNPFEAVQTNIVGAQNIINAAIDSNVKKVIALSTDKAVAPANLYGATKLCSDKLFVAGNSYSGIHRTRLAVVRYGNVVGSRGSVVPFFKKISKTKRLPITDTRMTRFWITLEQGVDFVLKCMEIMNGGEIFVPKIPSMKIIDLAKAIAPECKYEVVGIRPGEKIHEALIMEDDARHTLEFDKYYIIEPEFTWWSNDGHISNGGRAVKEDFSYVSNTNDKWLTVEELRSMVDGIE